MLLGIAVGCSSTATGDKQPGFADEHPMKEISASYGAFSDGQKLQVYVAFISNGFLRVRGGDAITVDVNGAVVPTVETIEDQKVHYIAEVSPPPAMPIVTITFARGAEKVSVKQTLGPSFDLVGAPPRLQASETLSLDVTPRPDLTKPPYLTLGGLALGHSIEVSGPCVDQQYQKIELTTAKDAPYPLAWDTKTLKLTGTGPCDLDVKVRMDTLAGAFVPEGPAKENLQGGNFEAAQHRTFRAQLTR